MDVGGVDFISAGLDRRGHLCTSFPPENMRETIGGHGLEALVEEKRMKHVFAGCILLNNALQINLSDIREVAWLICKRLFSEVNKQREPSAEINGSFEIYRNV